MDCALLSGNMLLHSMKKYLLKIMGGLHFLTEEINTYLLFEAHWWSASSSRLDSELNQISTLPYSLWPCHLCVWDTIAALLMISVISYLIQITMQSPEATI